MRVAHLRVVMGLGPLLAAPAAPSAAGVVANWAVNTIHGSAVAADPVLANMQSWSLMATTDGDWGAAGFEATLPAVNTFYNPPVGGNTKPNPTFLPIFGNLEFDTYVTAPGDTGTTGAPIILGGFPPAGVFDFGGSSGRFSVAWGDVRSDAPGTYEILRLTFPSGVVPAVNQFSYTTQTTPTAAAPAGINLGPPNQTYPTRDWLPDADGDWNDAGNWSGGALPGLRERIVLDVGGDVVRTITHASGDTELHELRSYERIVLSGGTISSYITEINDTLLINGGTFRPRGFHHLSGSGAVEVATGGSIVIGDGSALAIGGGATLRGTGGVVTGVAGLVFNNGGRILAPQAADTLTIDRAALSLQSGEVGGDGAVRLTGVLRVDGPDNAKTGAGPLRVNGTFTIAGSNTLDVSGGGVVNDYTGASPLSEIRAKIISGYANDAWTGTGINSSTAAADDDLAVGYAEASALFTAFPATFMGESIDDTTVLVRLVRNGDADLDGTVGLADFNRLAGGFGSTDALWDDGDFNYDGAVNLTDFNLLAANFGLSAAAPDGPTPDDWSRLAGAVPEPSCAALLVLAPSVLARRTRRAGRVRFNGPLSPIDARSSGKSG